MSFFSEIGSLQVRKVKIICNPRSSSETEHHVSIAKQNDPWQHLLVFEEKEEQRQSETEGLNWLKIAGKSQ